MRYTIAVMMLIIMGGVIIAGCIEEEELEINGVVVDSSPVVELPDYETQEYWISVEVVDGTRYKVKGEGVWMGYDIGDKFKQTVPDDKYEELK